MEAAEVAAERQCGGAALRRRLLEASLQDGAGLAAALDVAQAAEQWIAGGAPLALPAPAAKTTEEPEALARVEPEPATALEPGPGPEPGLAPGPEPAPGPVPTPRRGRRPATDEWSTAELDVLRRMWSENAPNAAIQAALPGRSQSAIQTRAFVLGLGRRARAGRAGGGRSKPAPAKVADPEAPAPPRRPPPPASRAPVIVQGRAGCQWPEGEPGAPDFRLCGRPRAPGESYCAEHCKRAYPAGRRVAAREQPDGRRVIARMTEELGG